jgi:NTP pyrophosphatase (non-canonical NTP hydrolase)
MDLAYFQNRIQATYGDRDRSRGLTATVAWLAEEVGELAKATRKGSSADQIHELGDVFAWLVSLANQLEISMEEAAAPFIEGCPKCQASPCECPEAGRAQS